MPVFPSTDPLKLVLTSRYKNDGFKETLPQIYTHAGTHMDPLVHIFADKRNLELYGRNFLRFSCFPLRLADCDGFPIRAVAWFESM